MSNLDFNNKAKRIPVCILIDNSLSMGEIVEGKEFCRQAKEQIKGDNRLFYYYVPINPNDKRIKSKMMILEDALRDLYKNIENDDFSNDSCDACIITFNSEAQLYDDFSSIEDKKDPYFDITNGDTNFTKGLDYALNCINKRIEEYGHDFDSFPPYIFLFTDGVPTDDTTRIKETLRKLEDANAVHLVIFSISNENKDLARLQELTNNKVIKCDDSYTLFSAIRRVSKNVIKQAHKIQEEVVGRFPKGFWADLK